jgi:hypothetical protein
MSPACTYGSTRRSYSGRASESLLLAHVIDTHFIAPVFAAAAPSDRASPCSELAVPLIRHAAYESSRARRHGLSPRFLFPYGNSRYLSGVAFFEAVNISHPRERE